MRLRKPTESRTSRPRTGQMRRRNLGSGVALALMATLGVAACTSSAAPLSPSPAASASVAVVPSLAGSPSPAASPSAAASASSAASPSDQASPAASAATAVPTSIDPCQLISAQEAGQLAGATFGPGKEETLSGNSRMCTYGAATKNVFEVIVAIAPDVATAQKQEASAQADLQANAAQLDQGMTITKLPGFAPSTDAVLMELKPNALGIGGRAMYVLRGTTFFGFSDLVVGAAAPSADAMKAEAMTVLGRLP
jgi:hypothetical protein